MNVERQRLPDGYRALTLGVFRQACRDLDWRWFDEQRLGFRFWCGCLGVRPSDAARLARERLGGYDFPDRSRSEKRP